VTGCVRSPPFYTKWRLSRAVFTAQSPHWCLAAPAREEGGCHKSPVVIRHIL
jgi:hypothetical protein